MQLDLFADSSPQMNPNRNPIAPDCFKDYKQYSEWLGLARLAKEACTICEDCREEYQTEMKLQERCHQEWYSVRIVMNGKSLPTHPIKQKSTPKEINYDKLYWEFKE